MDVTLDRDAYNTFWLVWLGLVLFAAHEWRDMFEVQRPTKQSCDKHPGTSRCRCRGNLPPGKR